MTRLTFLLLLLSLAVAGVSQDARTISGVVRDKGGNPLPKAVVELENRVTLNIRSCITDGDGAYSFSEVNPDVEFTLKAHYKNYWSKTETVSRFSEAKHIVKHLTIPID